MLAGLIGALLLSVLSPFPTTAAASATLHLPVAVRAMPPQYPAVAQNASTEGCALLSFNVSVKGKVEDIRILRSLPYPEFGRAARKALFTWRFTPARLRGRPSAYVGMTQTFRFSPSGENDYYNAPRCTRTYKNPPVFAKLAPPKPLYIPPVQPANLAPPSQPAPPTARIHTWVNLGVTRPPVTQTYAVPYGNNIDAVSGKVTMRFCVNKRGRTENLRVVHSVHGTMFDAMALAYMRYALFKPHTVHGSPVIACGITQTIIFRPAKH